MRARRRASTALYGTGAAAPATIPTSWCPPTRRRRSQRTSRSPSRAARRSARVRACSRSARDRFVVDARRRAGRRCRRCRSARGPNTIRAIARQLDGSADRRRARVHRDVSRSRRVALARDSRSRRGRRGASCSATRRSCPAVLDDPRAEVAARGSPRRTAPAMVPFAIPIDEPHGDCARAKRARARRARARRRRRTGPASCSRSPTSRAPSYGDLIDLYITLSRAATRRAGRYNGAPPRAGSMVVDARSAGRCARGDGSRGVTRSRSGTRGRRCTGTIATTNRALPPRRSTRTATRAASTTARITATSTACSRSPGCHPTLRLEALRRGLEDRALLELAATLRAGSRGVDRGVDRSARARRCERCSGVAYRRGGMGDRAAPAARPRELCVTLAAHANRRGVRADRRVLGHADDRDPAATQPYTISFRPDGGVWTTVTELAQSQRSALYEIPEVDGTIAIACKRPTARPGRGAVRDRGRPDDRALRVDRAVAAARLHARVERPGARRGQRRDAARRPGLHRRPDDRQQR